MEAELVGPHSAASRGSLGALALGVVYGDIGTSPHYTLKTALDRGALPLILSLRARGLAWLDTVKGMVDFCGVIFTRSKP